MKDEYDDNIFAFKTQTSIRDREGQEKEDDLGEMANFFFKPEEGMDLGQNYAPREKNIEINLQLFEDDKFEAERKRNQHEMYKAISEKRVKLQSKLYFRRFEHFSKPKGKNAI